MVKTVTKRNGSIEDYSAGKIQQAVYKGLVQAMSVEQSTFVSKQITKAVWDDYHSLRMVPSSPVDFLPFR